MENKCETKTASIDTTKNSFKLCKGCIICTEPVDLTELEEALYQDGHHIESKVCNKCRDAILRLRHEYETITI